MPLRVELRYTFAAPPERVWPLVADTERLNRALELPPMESAPLDDSRAVNRRRVQSRHLGMALEFEEEPFEWVEHRSFHVVRRFVRGPFLSFAGGTNFLPTPGGTEIDVWAEFEPRGRAAELLFPALRQKTVHDWNRFAARIRQHLAGESPVVYGEGVDTASAAVRRQAAAQLADLPPAVAAHPLAGRLAEHLATAGDLDLDRMRPFRLARAWGADRYEVLRLFLRATREGVLQLSWDLVCPNCRGGDLRAGSLGELRGEGHCGSCRIRYDANFDRYVEATFRPHPRYRAVTVRSYCMAGPRNTPHVAAQLVPAAGETRRIEPNLSPGSYRLRNLTGSTVALIEVGEGEAAETSAAFTLREGPEGGALAPGFTRLAGGPVCLEIRNETAGAAQLVLERAAWDADCATAAEISLFQEFRDLFGSEVLAPDVQLGIESLPLLFTDLKGSTELYQRLGDAAAFGVVRDHFDFLAAEIAARGGGIIKTIGDSAMAAFPTAAAAVDCALAVQRGIDAFNREQGRGEIVLKMGLHQGPCIAVRANDRLDYFGSTVNLAARLHGESRGGDLVLSDAVHADPEVQRLMEGVPAEPFRARLRGIAAEQQLWRIS